jgi:hypothetical protein
MKVARAAQVQLRLHNLWLVGCNKNVSLSRPDTEYPSQTKRKKGAVTRAREV